MYERPVRRVHQADDGLVHAAGQVGIEMRHFVAGAEDRQFRRCGRRLADGAAFRIREERPDVAVALLAGKTPGVDSFAFEFGILAERRDGLALPGVRLELPAVVGALYVLAVELAERKRKRAVRADVAQREWFCGSVAAQHQRHVQKHRAYQLMPPHLVAAQRGIPESPQHVARAPVRAGSICFGHFAIHPSTQCGGSKVYAGCGQRANGGEEFRALMSLATLELTRHRIADILGLAMTAMFASFY